MRTVTALLLLLCTAAGAYASRRSARLEELGWMAGCWQAGTASRGVEEQWMRPRAGSMVGMSRTVRGDSTVGYELMRIVERQGKLVFVAHPSGQAPAEFRESRLEAGSVVFESPEHDFPQRVLYRRAGADSLVARVDGVRSGQPRGMDFRYRRTVCP